MADHNRGIKYLVTWFLNQIQGILSVQNIQHNNTCNSLCIIPTDILNLCGKFYDQFYAVTIDIKYHNLDLNVVYPLDAPITRCSSTQFTAFQLLDPKIIHQKYFPSENATNMKFYTFYVHHKNSDPYDWNNYDIVHGQILGIRLPTDTFINVSVLKQMILDILNPYLTTEYTQGAFGIYLKNYSLNGLYQVYIPSIRYNCRIVLCLIRNENHKRKFLKELKGITWNTLKQLEHVDNGEIIIKWNSLKIFDKMFSNDFLLNPVDTESNHVCAVQIYEDDDTQAINQIENMFDSD